MPRPPRRPTSIRLGAVGASVVRGPDAEGRWYWRIRRGEDQLWTGWATVDDVTAELGRHAGGTAEVGRGSSRTVRDLLDFWLGDQVERAEVGQLGARTVLTWTPEEWALVEAAAGRLGQDPAEWARRVLLGAATPPAPSTPTSTRGRSRSRSRHTPGTA